MEACDAIYYPMKNKKSNTALKMRKRRRLGAFIFVVVLLALAVVAVRIYNMNKPSRDAELLTLVNPWNTIPDGVRAAAVHAVGRAADRPPLLR